LLLLLIFNKVFFWELLQLGWDPHAGPVEFVQQVLRGFDAVPDMQLSVSKADLKFV